MWTMSALVREGRGDTIPDGFRTCERGTGRTGSSGGILPGTCGAGSWTAGPVDWSLPRRTIRAPLQKTWGQAKDRGDAGDGAKRMD